MLMQESMRDSRDPGGRRGACRGESSSLLKILRRERRAAAAIAEARYSYGRRCAGNDSIDDYQRQVSRLGACISNLEGMGVESSVAGRQWVARAALSASAPSDRVDATTAAAIRAVKDAAAAARSLVADARTMAPAARSETVAVRDAARRHNSDKTQAMRDEATAMAAAAATAAAAEAMAEAGSRVEQADRAGWAERRALEGASMAEKASIAHVSREARAAAAMEHAEEALRQAHTSCTHLAHTIHATSQPLSADSRHTPRRPLLGRCSRTTIFT